MAETLVRSYRELIRLKTFEERYNYVRLAGTVGARTFGSYRALNQALYTSGEWRSFKDHIILRDQGRDLAMEGYDILGDRIIIHHLNFLTIEDLINRSPKIFDEDNVVCTSHRTHEAIHYGDASLLPVQFTARRPGDTCPWKL